MPAELSCSDLAWRRRACPRAGLAAILVVAVSLGILPRTAGAHFGVILPSDDMVGADESRLLELQVMFMHPFEGTYMDMARPVRCGVRVRGQVIDLLPALQPASRRGARAWTAAYQIQRPGDHVFFVEPEPYFEAAEECFIVHYTKVIVHALGMESGWDEPAGLETEIIPLSRPYGLWRGNVFQGRVMRDGQPVPHAEVEVELLAEGRITPPADPFVTQVVRAGADGVFTYGLPCAGWWGFAALGTAAAPRRHSDGREYPVEIGAVLWVRAYDLE